MTQANSTATPTEGQTDKPQDADKEKTCYLSQEELGGVILYFSDDTFSECSTKQLFGLHHKQCDYVKKLKPRLPLFLFNSSDRKLYGIFEVISPVQLNTDQFAWISESLDASSEVTPPAQVYLSAKTECSPLTENQYRKVITNNYLDEKHGCFYLELDHEQTTELSSLFLPAQSMVPNDPQARKDVSDQVKCEYVSSSKVRFASTSSISRSNLANDASDKNTLMTTDNGRKDLQHSYASQAIEILPFMNNITLDGCEFPNAMKNDLQVLLSACPKLKHLELLYPVFSDDATYDTTDLKVPELLTLVVETDEINVNWELYAPNIDTVKLRMSRAFCVNILPKCTNARTLSIEAYTLPNTNIEPCFFSKLITLCLDIFFDRGCMPTVLDLLESYPILELLKLQSCDPGYGKESDSFWDSQQRIFSPSLYKVELRGFVGTIREINLMNYLLKTAKSIQNFTIVVDSDSEIQVVGFPLFRSSMESIFVSRRSEVV
uniref:DCD domain-containing protein n=2 Tax=Leersia perrieri TaxID=77586 RepID=A0A0D9XE76_9ORYZ